MNQHGGGGWVEQVLSWLQTEGALWLDAVMRALPAALVGVLVGAVQRTVSFNGALERHTAVVAARLGKIEERVQEIRDEQLVAHTKAEAFRDFAGTKIEGIDQRLDNVLVHYLPRPHRRSDDA